MRSIGKEDIRVSVYSVAVNKEGTVLLVGNTSNEEKVMLFDLASGVKLRSFGRNGASPGQLEFVVGLRFTPDGSHIMIAEANNSRLSLFTVDGKFVRCIDGVGTPYDVDFATNGDIIVADYKPDNNRVIVLSRDGDTLLKSFGGEDSDFEFSRPSALSVHCGMLYVLDGDSRRVKIFS